MSELIENIMLHAKARLGGGIRISATPDAPLYDALHQIVEEVRATVPNHEVTVDLQFDRPVSCDAPRVAQAVSNLLSMPCATLIPGLKSQYAGALVMQR